MASPLLRFVFLLACVVNVAKAAEEASTAEATNHEDVEAILRELQTQGEPAPDMAATASIQGAFTFTVENPTIILGNTTVKAAFELSMEQSIAADLPTVSAGNVDATASAGTRRLESAEPRQLAGKIKVDYTITVPSAQSTTVLASVKTALTVAKIQEKTQAAIRGIDAALCPDCATATVTGVVVNTAPAVQGATSSSTGTDTSSADRSHVLWAIFSFAATWFL
jgi:hypothetical protein